MILFGLCETLTNFRVFRDFMRLFEIFQTLHDFFQAEAAAAAAAATTFPAQKKPDKVTESL